MPQESLQIEDLPGDYHGQRVLRLHGEFILTTLFDFMKTLRSDGSPSLIIDFTDVPYADSAGIGALVGAYVRHQNEGRKLSLVGVCKRVHDALTVTRVEQFFRFFDTVADAE